MKTTVDLPAKLILEGKKTALERGTTLKSLIEKGLYREIYSPSSESSGVMKTLASLDSSIWRGVEADAFVKQQRDEWE